MDQPIREHGRMESITAKANLHGLMVPTIWVSTNTAKRKDTVLSTTLRRSFMRVAGTMECRMVRVLCMVLMGVC